MSIIIGQGVSGILTGGFLCWGVPHCPTKKCENPWFAEATEKLVVLRFLISRRDICLATRMNDELFVRPPVRLG